MDAHSTIWAPGHLTPTEPDVLQKTGPLEQSAGASISSTHPPIHPSTHASTHIHPLIPVPSHPINPSLFIHPLSSRSVARSPARPHNSICAPHTVPALFPEYTTPPTPPFPFFLFLLFYYLFIFFLTNHIVVHRPLFSPLSVSFSFLFSTTTLSCYFWPLRTPSLLPGPFRSLGLIPYLEYLEYQHLP
ncbi:hypothetical protein F4778DRAFT_50935 [Xylariomycetidae sp. FL2044]|nr:hypothetical protein F4778DRAFT_50935 [Xylariomycetidae sp. FL2044]